MPVSYYPKLAYDSIKKNRQLYVPFILTCILMVSIYYIVSFLTYSESISNLPEASAITTMLYLGSFIMAIFSVIFLFYTNTFLIKRRKKEFGLYSILGLSKANIICILFYEYLIIGTVSIVSGILIGIIFSKLFELGLYHIIGAEINYQFSISTTSITMTVIVFSCIFLLLLINTFLQVQFTKISQLLVSEAVGEKPPKGNWFLAILGLISLGIGYLIAVNIQNPVAALIYFFVAVVFVIIGTYLLLIAGSVVFCRLLQKNKRFYYKLNHFISVSSMAYRMKRNGAGLASICILSTMVLVTLCFTVCLYIGTEDTVYTLYQRQLNTTIRLNNVDDLSNENFDYLNNYIDSIVHNNNDVILEPYNYMSSYLSAKIDGSNLILGMPNFESITMDDLRGYVNLNLISLSDYNRLTNSKDELNENEVIVQTSRIDYNSNTITLNDSLTFTIKQKVDNKFNINSELSVMVLPTITLIVPDLLNTTKAILPYINQEPNQNINTIEYSYTYNFDINAGVEIQNQVMEKLNEALDEPTIRQETGIIRSECVGREYNRSGFITLYGGLFYLGFILSIIFILGTVLIIYYKQISEGFEDKSRFEIMQKVGLSKKEIRKTINSQILTVFFIPLVFAIINLIFAYPVMEKMLMMFNFYNVKLFFLTTVICVIIFSVFYSIVYKITSNEYYKIVT